MALKPICHPCQRFYRPEKNGFYFIEGMPVASAQDCHEGKIEPGTSMPERWKPYKLWSGDLWRCHGCNHQIVVGVISSTPIAEHYQADFAEEAKRLNATYQVNDC